MLNPSRLDRRLGAEDRADDGRRLVPAGHARHRHRRHRREGDAAGQGSADGADRHGTSCKARGPQNKLEELRIELYDKVNALGIGAQGLGGLTTVLDVKITTIPTHAASQAGGDDPELRGHAPRALRARRLAARRTSSRPSSRPGPTCNWAPDCETRSSVDLDTLTQEEVASWKPGETLLLSRQDADRPRRRAQAHPGHARQGRAAAGRLHQPRHLLRRPGRSGARRSGRPGRPDHRDAHGQVHRDDAGEDRPDRDDRQGRARPGRRSRRSASTRRPT